MTEAFGKPLSKSFLITPMHRGPREDFLKSVISCRVSAYDQISGSQFNNTISNPVQYESKANETKVTGFTKQQLNRLLSTKKSSAKKFRHSKFEAGKKVKKAMLFNESTSSMFKGSISFTRSHSSPNLLDSKEQVRIRRLSTMKEDQPSLEVSGIVALNQDSNQSTPRESSNLEISRKVSNFSSMPSITGISSTTSLPCILTYIPPNEVVNQEGDIQIEVPKRNSELFEEPKSETPAPNTKLIKRTGSLEKIINRYKKFHASAVPKVNLDSNEFKTIDEENLNMANIESFKTNRNLLPDLLSPSCSTITQRYDDLEHWFDNDDVSKRMSLGTALGVDYTFLDQFDLDSD